jgi:transcriptional regulator with XRE-family HTH domain
MGNRALDERHSPSAMASGLRAAREARRLSQRELAARVNVSPSMISQIEAGQSQPSVNTLYSIVSELDISLDELFGHRPGAVPEGRPVAIPDAGPRRRLPPPMGRIPVTVTEEARSTLRLETGVTWERLATPDSETLDFMEVVYDVGGTSSREGTLMRHNSVEFSLLLSGSLDVQVGFDVHHLGAGDSIAFDSTVPHRLWNPGDVPARAVWVVLPH